MFKHLAVKYRGSLRLFLLKWKTADFRDASNKLLSKHHQLTLKLYL